METPLDILPGDEYGRDERSLAKLPFTLLGKRDGRRKEKEIRSEWNGQNERGKPVRFFKNVTWNARHGPPDYPAEEVYIALLYYLVRDGLADRTTRVVPYRLLKLMNWGTDGRAYDRLKRSLNQLRGVTIHTNALWDEKSKTFVEAGFGIIDDWLIRKGSAAPLFSEGVEDGSVLEVNWNERVYEHFKRGRLKLLNVGEFYSLPSPLAKRLYRWVDEALYPSGRVEIDIRHLAHNRLEMSRSMKFPSTIMQSLEPALEEIRKLGKCEWSLEESTTDSGKKLVFSLPPESLPPVSEADQGYPQGPPPADQDRWLDEQLARLTAEEVEALKRRAVDLLDAFNKGVYLQRGDDAIGARQLVRENMRRLIAEEPASPPAPPSPDA